MANSRHGIEGKHGTLLGLGEDNVLVSWGGSIEAIQPTGTLSDGREALLRMGLALANLSRPREGRAPRGEGGEEVSVGVVLKCSESTVGGGMCVTEANSKREG